MQGAGRRSFADTVITKVESEDGTGAIVSPYPRDNLLFKKRDGKGGEVGRELNSGLSPSTANIFLLRILGREGVRVGCADGLDSYR